MNASLINFINNYDKKLSQRQLATACGFSLGKINNVMNTLKKEGYIENNELTNKVNDYKVNNAIILAAGPGLRTLPLNDETPKPLLKINDEALIERLIKQLKEKGINDIRIVVGYKKEKFEYLIDKYDIRLIINKFYGMDNNLYSAFLASKYFNNTYIIPGDLYFFSNPFNKYEFCSYYTLSDVQRKYGYYFVDKNGDLIIGKSDYYDAIGLSYIDKKDSPIIKDNLSALVNEKAHTYWESSLFYLNDYKIKVRFIPSKDYKEVNTYEDLRQVDSQSDSLNNSNIKIICEVFNIDKNDIRNVTISKKGMTNRSFTFEVNGKKYIMRIPGEGTDKLISRKQEYEVYKVVSPIGISDKVIYMNPDSGVKITEFFPDSHNCDAFNEDEVKIAMKKLKEFHSLKLHVDFEFNIFSQILYYEELMGKTSLYPDYEEVKGNVFALKPFIDQVKLPYQLCHIDSVPDNFLISEKETKLIDWEYSSLQDPHVDIAMFAIYSGYDKRQIDKLIDIYFENKCDIQTRMKIYAYVAMTGLLWSNWCEYKSHLGVEFGEYSLNQYRYGKEFSKLVLNYLNSHYNAIIMAAGKGTRLYPLTEDTPKPLLKIHGTPMIENLISNLLDIGVVDITIVTGYKKEQFEYLKDKYHVNIINNPDYDTANNISSLYYAREKLNNTIILDGDQIISNKEILKINPDHSGYVCIKNSDDEFVNEWILQLGENNRVLACNRNGDKGGYILKSLSYWNSEDSQKLKECLIEIYEKEHRNDVYWDDVAMFINSDQFQLYGYPINSGDIVEIDSLDELKEIDESYR